MIEELIESWDGEQVVARYDRPSGAWMFVCVHSTRLGPAAGGTRMKVYGSPGEALRDGMRLAEAMTAKYAVAGLPQGGGKAVIAVRELPGGAQRRALLLRYADLVDSLGGTYVTAPDMNTSEADMDVVGERTRFVFGRSRAAGGSGSSGPNTAAGVLRGIAATMSWLDGRDDLAGLTVAVQGVGGVGERLCELLVEAGCRVLASDVLAERAEALARRLGCGVVAAGEVIAAPCDVFSPCATGGILNAGSVARLRCRVIAGAANNQLEEPSVARALMERGILYAPDYVINAGGALQIGLEVLGWSPQEYDARLQAIGQRLVEIYERARAEGIDTAAAAAEVARRNLEAAPPGRFSATAGEG